MMESTNPLRDSQRPNERVGVFGFGNALRGDDGIVPVVFERVRLQDEDLDAELREFGARTFRVVHALRDFDRVLLVDAMRFGGDPGEVVVCTPEEVSSRSGTNGSHELDLLELVELVTQVSEAPDEIRIFGIEPGSMEMGEELSGPVATRIPEIETKLRETISAF